jgi:hypothetical protein
MRRLNFPNLRLWRLEWSRILMSFGAFAIVLDLIWVDYRFLQVFSFGHGADLVTLILFYIISLPMALVLLPICTNGSALCAAAYVFIVLGIFFVYFGDRVERTMENG